MPVRLPVWSLSVPMVRRCGDRGQGVGPYAGRNGGRAGVARFDLLATAADLHAFFDAQGGAPLMIKAVNGGGGRGMRIVQAAEEIDAAFAQAQAETLAAFGDDQLYAERFLQSVRHIEVQIVGDGQDVTHLWERDCTVQRRHQKVIELAPAPNLSDATRDGLLNAAVAIGRACGYRGLGTVEFLVEAGGAFHFIETNPRIQVEHTITEEITGFDLVEIQLGLAAGLSLAQVGLGDAPARPRGFAVQARINAETPDGQGALPHGRASGHLCRAFGSGRADRQLCLCGIQHQPEFRFHAGQAGGARHLG